MRRAFVKTVMYFSVLYNMTFTNKCHPCKITELFVGHGCQNHRLSCQIYRLLPQYCLSLAATLWAAIVGLAMIIRTKRKMRYAFVKTAIYFSVGHVMVFTNKWGLCKITEFYKDQWCHRQIQSYFFLNIGCQLITLWLLWDYYDNKDKKIDETCFCEDCNIFLCTPCHDVHKQMPCLLKHRILLSESTAIYHMMSRLGVK